MTTRVIISSVDTSHEDVQVEAVGTDGTVHQARRLTGGERCEMWVHSHMSLRVTEIARAPKETP